MSMKAKTYRELKKWLEELPEDRLDDHISILDLSDEYQEIAHLVQTRETDVLDEGHPLMVIKGEFERK